MKKFSFIHAADLHLDSPFRGITSRSSHVAHELRSATFDTYESLIRLCIDKQVQFLLIAGDIYDGSDRSLRAQLKFLDGLKILSNNNIRSFVVHGNHDPLESWSSTIEWPDEVCIFKGSDVETKMVKMDGKPIASVSGISFQRKNEHSNLARKFKATNPEVFQIGVMHCNCGGNPYHAPYAPCTLDDLTSAGFDYWALGHVHEKNILSKNPCVVYPGNTQGLNIREQGERGCYLVTVSEDHHVDLEFCPLDTVRWLTSEIAIDNIASFDILDQALADTLERLRDNAEGRLVVCRIRISGRGPLSGELRKANVATDLLERVRETGFSGDPFVWVQDFDIDCRPQLDMEQRRNVNDLLGQILSLSNEITELLQEKDADSPALLNGLQSALNELYANRRAAKILEPVTPENLKKIIGEAELLCVDLMESEE